LSFSCEIESNVRRSKKEEINRFFFINYLISARLFLL
jgi:hypothetical protein